MTNTFWIAANIIFDLTNGDTRQVFMLVNTVEAASIFTTHQEALTAFSFVQARAQNIQWFLDPPIPQRPQGWTIRGVQVITTR